MSKPACSLLQKEILPLWYQTVNRFALLQRATPFCLLHLLAGETNAFEKVLNVGSLSFCFQVMCSSQRPIENCLAMVGLSILQKDVDLRDWNELSLEMFSKCLYMWRLNSYKAKGSGASIGSNLCPSPPAPLATIPSCIPTKWLTTSNYNLHKE